jgi:hypothetical protein
MRKLVWTLLALVVAVPLHAQERWDLTGPRVSVRLNTGLMRDLGIRVTPSVRPDKDGYAAYALGSRGTLTAVAPGSIFRTVDQGELAITSGPTLSWKNDGTSLRGARLRPGAEENSFVIAGADGIPLFFADHEHWTVDRKARTIRIFNADLRLSTELAARLNEPRHEGLAVGVLEINASAAIPTGSVETPLGACVNPNWGNPHNDVSLIALSEVSQVARDSGYVAVAPSAVLKNVGVTDVPWIAKFAPPRPPYNNDQHPFLIWNMYRIAGGRLEQIGASGAKHAFLTINSGCGCPQGDTLWVNCEDIYGVFTNDSSTGVGPRDEIAAHSGVWTRCGSFFDPNCDGAPDSVPGFSGAADFRRMAVRETDLQMVPAQYFQDGWYVVRDDTNIFNTMAYRSITPAFNGSSWSFGPLGAQSFGSVVDAWVQPANTGAHADNQRWSHAAGHVTVGMRATDLGAGRWRYDYAVQNHDFDYGLTTFAVPLPTGALVTNTYYHDGDRDPNNGWIAVVSPGQIRFQPPKTAMTAQPYVMGWGLLTTFSFEVDAAPTLRAGSTLALGVGKGLMRTITIPVMGPIAQ